MASNDPPPQESGRSSRPPLLDLNPATAPAVPQSSSQKKRKGHRGGRKKRNRRQSFAMPSDLDAPAGDSNAHREPRTAATMDSSGRPSFYKNLSTSSLESEALLDHRDHQAMRPRRDSRPTQNLLNMNRPGQTAYEVTPAFASYRASFAHGDTPRSRRPTYIADSDEEQAVTDSRTPLLNSSREGGRPNAGYGIATGKPRGSPRSHPAISREPRSSRSSVSSRRRRPTMFRDSSAQLHHHEEYDVNNPPSVPTSPKLGAGAGFDDVMVGESYSSANLPQRRATVPDLGGDHLIDIDDDGDDGIFGPSDHRRASSLNRRRTVAATAEEDVCFPQEGLSVLAEDDMIGEDETYQGSTQRSRRRPWPDLSMLEEWSREEKESRSEGNRAKKVSEPLLVGGRLRLQSKGWHREEEDAPYRFTYFNEEFENTIHSQTISELLQPGQTFRELFIPDPPEISDYSDEDDDDLASQPGGAYGQRSALSPNGHSHAGTRQSSVIGDPQTKGKGSSGEATPAAEQQDRSGLPNSTKNKSSASQPPHDQPKRYGPRPVFWLDVLCPTEMEMRVISSAFGIHPLTSEDIMQQEAREKVELFRNYYFVNYRTFEQDNNSSEYLEPVNMYAVIFRDGVISFHFSQSPHPANVRRRIRQLKDYLILSADWISYALIDDITDAFAPLIQSIEEEVDDIDDAILRSHMNEEPTAPKSSSDVLKAISDKINDHDEKRSQASGRGDNPLDKGNMLLRVGQQRKKVMGMYRLLGNKADVIKGFAKRCNEQWQIAPRNEIGLYLGDIQDHILTMTSNLGHYETLLSRAHSNYLAQINIRMNERQEQTADVLGKLTVLGTIVLPMNIVTGMWGMNVLVPGQDVDNLYWFWSITAGLVVFGFSCFFIAKRVYGIV